MFFLQHPLRAGRLLQHREGLLKGKRGEAAAAAAAAAAAVVVGLHYSDLPTDLK